MRAKWKIKFSWVKAHVRIFGNKMADRLAKEVAGNDETSYEYSEIPISALIWEAAEEALNKWQDQWTKTSKTEATKQYFPTVQDIIGTKIHLTAKLTAVLTGHGKRRHIYTGLTYGMTRSAYVTRGTKQWTTYYSSVQRRENETNYNSN